ncbi:hypothetical protein Q4Q35_00530 [Flavivirga aquimarina]|uniref:Uncharacterized protein n=1 Tax=Flavivirga aquimarina TaxID=2027862 RepID=A0ABT8W594_9FLAO|nr:hypothetical protein [Flavivirga aquimarina]MDO5968280.1 hypothetical protein [Flavivirga aquimarina]
MIKTVQRLEFENVFGDEDQKDILDYLKRVSQFSLLNIIGFSNTRPQPNFDNFFSNRDVQWDIIQRVTKYGKENQIPEPPEVVSRETSLKLAEIILANREAILNDNVNDDKDADELNLFKAFLIVNKEVNEKQNFGDAEDNINKMADILITMSFSSADIGVYSNIDLEFGKVLYTTIVKFEHLIEFLQSNEEYIYLGEAVCAYFDEENLETLNEQVKLLFGTLLKLKHNNSYKLVLDKQKHIRFLNTLASAEIEESEDYTNLKNYPVYKINDNTFSIIDYFYVVDKFFKSVRFILKDAYNSHHNLPKKDGSFFSFYNTKFSEEFLMKRVLDDVFHWKYMVKRQEAATKDNEPDYYTRHNNRIYLFENKDILVAAGIKSSDDIDEIKKLLKKKFLKDGSRAVGIGQLVKSIEQIVKNQFPFDEYANNKKNLTIYPILLVSDRVFEIMGMNYILNQWYIKLVKEKLGEQYNPGLIRDLTFIDMDTLIYWLPYLKNKDRYFKDIIDTHHKSMKKVANINNPNIQEGMRQANKSFYNRLSPMSNRLNKYKFPLNLLVDKFRDVFPE